MKLIIFEKQRKHNEYLLEWQKAVITDSPNKLVFTEERLREITTIQAKDDLRIIDDCVELVSKTLKPDVFFMRLNLIMDKYTHLRTLERYIKFKGASPTAAYHEAVCDYQKAIELFLVRYFTDTFDKAETMKTDKGKINKYINFHESLKPYYAFMSDKNIDYIENKVNVYTRSLKGGDAMNPKPQKTT